MLSNQPLCHQEFISKASLPVWCVAQSPMPSAWPVSTASSVGKPLQIQSSFTSAGASSEDITVVHPPTISLPAQCPRPVPPALTLIQHAKPSTTSISASVYENPPTLGRPIPSIVPTGLH